MRLMPFIRTPFSRRLVVLLVTASTTWLVFNRHVTTQIEQDGQEFMRENYLYSGEYYLADDKLPSNEEVLNRQRRNIQLEFKDNPLLPALGVQKLAELVPEQGGKAVSTLLVTSWRSGSSFLGEVLNAHPGTFYHYEPLHHFGVKQIQSDEERRVAIDHISELLRCNYTGMAQFVAYSSARRNYMLAYNKRLWWVCLAFHSFCTNREFLSSYCKLFPFNLAKLGRLRMAQTEPFLEDQSLSVRIVLLVRDPRATIRSRMTSYWCRRTEGCADPKKMCSDLVSDFKVALHFRQKFPGKVFVTRYEDLVSDAFDAHRNIYNFLSFNFSTPVQRYLEDQSMSEEDQKWREELSFQEVGIIQSHCKEAMNLLGYRIATGPDALHHFIPPYEFSFLPHQAKA